MNNKDHFREPQISLSSDGVIGVGVRPTDEDDATKEFACYRVVPEWMIKRAYAAILKREIGDD